MYAITTVFSTVRFVMIVISYRYIIVMIEKVIVIVVIIIIIFMCPTEQRRAGLVSTLK